MLRFLAAAGAILGLMAASMNDAAAQIACGDRDQILTSFARAYNEVPMAVGITDRGGLIEVLVAPTGTWTMLLTMPGGPACIIGTGHDWYARPLPGPEKVA